MSIATTRGDGGQTGLAGGIRVSKADLRVEAYGSVDELNTVLGFARSICTNKEIHDWTESIQRTLFRLGSALATPPESKKQPPVISSACNPALRNSAVSTRLLPWSLEMTPTLSPRLVRFRAAVISAVVFPAPRKPPMHAIRAIPYPLP